MIALAPQKNFGKKLVPAQVRRVLVPRERRGRAGDQLRRVEKGAIDGRGDAGRLDVDVEAPASIARVDIDHPSLPAPLLRRAVECAAARAVRLAELDTLVLRHIRSVNAAGRGDARGRGDAQQPSFAGARCILVVGKNGVSN